jgi:PHD-finger
VVGATARLQVGSVDLRDLKWFGFLALMDISHRSVAQLSQWPTALLASDSNLICPTLHGCSHEPISPAAPSASANRVGWSGEGDWPITCHGGGASACGGKMDPTHADPTIRPPPSSYQTLTTVASTGGAANPMPNTAPPYANGPQYNAILSAPYTEPSAKPRTPLLPPQWSSTERTLSGVFARNDGRMDPRKDPPKGWFPLSNPKYCVMPTSNRDVSSGPDYITSSAQQPPCFSKADLMSTLTTSLAPKSGFLPSQNHSSTNGSLYNSETDSDPDYKNSTILYPPGAAPLMGDTITAQASGFINSPALATTMKTISPQTTVSHPPFPGPTALGRPSSSNPSRKVYSYVLPDGTITNSGKGLGRGRPGIKRGPRKSKLSTEVTAEQTETSLPPTPPTPPAAAPKTNSTNSKRKRNSSASSENVRAHLSRSNSSTPEYTPQSTQTRSGRQTQKPVVFVPSSSPAPGPVVAGRSPSTPVPPTAKKIRPGSSTPNSSTPSQRANLAHPKIKRRVYRGAAREQTALCEHCLRGNGPPNNAIVFCDACNRCWHQRCHEPRIPKDVINDAKKEWVCRECDAILRGTKKGKQAKKTSAANSTAATGAGVDASDRGALNTPSIPIGLVPGSALTRDQRVAFLSKLSKDRLIDLVLRASDLAPLLPLFEDPNPPPPPQTPTPKYNGTAQATADEDEGFQSGDDAYEYYLDEHAILYPKAGHGIKLPPESVDLAMLLEGPECKTFSHWVARPAGSLVGAGPNGVLPMPGSVASSGL